MKKFISLFLVLALCFCLCACGEDTNSGNNANGGNNGNNANTTTTTKGEELVLRDEDGYAFINQKRFWELVETVELTMDNWADYLEVSSYTEEKIYKDAFGEVVSTETNTYHILGAKGDKCFYLSDFAIELKDKATGEATIYQANEGEVTMPEGFRLDQYECTRIKGTLYLVEVPQEAIWEDENGVRHFTVRYVDISYGPPIACSIAGEDCKLLGRMFSFLL